MYSSKSSLSRLLGCFLIAGASFLDLRAANPGAFDIDPTLKPDDNRFTPVVVTQGTLNEPMSFEVLEDGRVFLIERKGGVKLFDPVDASVKSIGQLHVNTTGNKEQGLVGMTLHPDFKENGWMYLYYHDPDEPRAIISRWDIVNNTLVANSEIVMLQFPAQRETCCHTGGGMAWDAAGNLYITVGNNTGNNAASHTDERPGRSSWDDQRGASSTDSLEGKILRIHPEPDGSYTIPSGNLFPLTMPNTRPEIYTMGHRNPWRVAVDSETGWIYWGEVGPDARQDSEIGPKGYDEFNQAREPGFFGWPYFVGDSAYPVMDYETNTPGKKKNPKGPTNLSPNNTGMVELPPLAPSFVYYPYDASSAFPALGTGGRSATGGPIYRRGDVPKALRPWPAYFEGKWIVAELSRRALYVISMEDNGDFKSLERFLPDYRPVEPIDMKFGPNGDLYVLEYGGRWFQYSPEAKLVRISFEAGNRKPIVMAKSDKTGGVPPFEVALSSDGTEDYDKDALAYRWEIIDAGGNVEVREEPNPTVTLTSIGTYNARLTVTDTAGASDSASVPIVSGNEPPEVFIQFKGNQTFYFPGAPVAYAVDVVDAEDGTFSKGDIDAEEITFSIDQVASDFDVDVLKQMPLGDAAASRFPIAQSIIAKANCRSCHLVDAKLVGPSFREIAVRYEGDEHANENLAQKVVGGSRGVWGEVPMPPNALLSEDEAQQVLKYILSLADDRNQGPSLVGHYTFEPPVAPPGRRGFGGRRGGRDTKSLLFRAVYKDAGDDLAASLTSQNIQLLSPARLQMASADVLEGIEVGRFGASISNGAHAIFRDIDLTQVIQLDVTAFANSRNNQTGGTIEVRLNGPEGKLIGAATLDAPKPPQEGGRRGFGGLRRDPLHLAIGEISGKKNLCLIFRNNAADDDANLMSVFSINLLAELTENQKADGPGQKL